MEVKIETRETDFQNHIGVNTQEGGVCISLGRDDGWHWISNECAKELAATLLVTSPAGDVLNERHRQITAEGFDTVHDDEHTDGSLAIAAACYASPHRIYVKRDYADSVTFLDPWPWDQRWDRRPYEGNTVRSNGSKGEKHRRKLLVKAGALILAEIERIDRVTVPNPAGDAK